MQQKNGRGLSIVTVFVTVVTYGFMFNMEQSLASDAVTPEGCAGVRRGYKEFYIEKTKAFPESASRQDIAHLKKVMETAINMCDTQDGNVRARQRYLMDNQTGNIPIMRTGTTSESQKTLDRMDNQIRAERGMAEARRKERNAAACLYRSSDCK